MNPRQLILAATDFPASATLLIQEVRHHAPCDVLRLS
jgi:hypothetical protein